MRTSLTILFTILCLIGQVSADTIYLTTTSTVAPGIGVSQSYDTGGALLNSHNVGDGIGIAVDPANNSTYWSENNHFAGREGLVRADLDLTNPTVLVPGSSGGPFDAVRDMVAGNGVLYVSVFTQGLYEVDPVLGNPQQLLGNGNIKGVEFDAANNFLYLAQDTGGGTGKIMRLDLNSMNLTDIVTGLNRPRGLEFDPVTNELWFAELFEGIRRVSATGGAVTDVINGPSFFEDALVDRTNGFLYYSHNGNVIRTDLTGLNPTTFVSLAGSVNSLDGIFSGAAVPEPSSVGLGILSLLLLVVCGRRP